MKTKSIIFAIALLIGAISTTANAQTPSIPGLMASSSNSGSYFPGSEFDFLGRMYVTYDDIATLDGWQIKILKNSIYARHGYIFKDPYLRDFFNSCWWYYGYRKSIPTKEFNKYERANIKFLKRYEY